MKNKGSVSNKGNGSNKPRYRLNEKRSKLNQSPEGQEKTVLKNIRYQIKILIRLNCLFCLFNWMWVLSTEYNPLKKSSSHSFQWDNDSVVIKTHTLQSQFSLSPVLKNLN